MEFPPNVWGPFFWHTIHIVALGYSSEPSYIDKKSAKEFYESLQFLIPCPLCKEHYKEHLREFPVTPFLDSKKDLLKWTIELHNRVNKTIGKPVWTEYHILEYYRKLGKTKGSPIMSVSNLWYMDIAKFLIGVITGSLLTLGVLSGLKSTPLINKSFFLKK